MAFFVTILALGLIYVTYRPVQTILVLVSITILIIVFFLISLIWLGCISSGGRDGAFLLLLPLIMLAAVFFLIAPGFCGRL